MATLSLLARWQAIPRWFRLRLLHGSVGSSHCLRLASLALTAMDGAGADSPTLLAVAQGLLLAAWEDDPCNGQLAGQLLLLHTRAPWLGQHTHALLTSIRDGWHRPPDLARLEHLAARQEWPRILRLVETERDKAPHNLFWLQQGVAAAELAGDTNWLERELARPLPPALAPLVRYLGGCLLANRADADNAATGHGERASEHTIAHEHASEHTPALNALRATSAAVPDHVTTPAGAWLAPMERAGHCMLRLGNRQGACTLWRTVLAARPWHVSLALRLHDIEQGHDAPLAAPAGSTAALLYCWNKADDLNTAISHVADSLDDLRLMAVLDNGSTDATGDVVRSWAGRIGPERFLAVHLPVNVGAPAARNWLMHLPQVAACEYAAYVDDDAAVPRHWLRHLARAVDVQPGAGAWGCRILDAHAPALVQSAALHLVPCFKPGPATTAHLAAQHQGLSQSALTAGPEDAPWGYGEGLEDEDVAFSPLRAHATPFTVSDLHTQVTDLGRFDHIRPCLSVTGCCHMFRTADLLAGGDFSLALSPSQYDDLEHDLRAARRGQLACYTGFVAVTHAKRTGKACRMSPAQFGNGLGNRYKMHGMYSAADIAAMYALECATLEQDMERRLAFLDSGD